VQKQKSKTYEVVSDLMESSKPVKIGVYIIIGVFGLYVIGHVFKIFAHTVRGYKDFSPALKE
jgi:uncharacterized membrane protein YuzA (DUF378 family)